jgi:hypothetical protein
MESASIAFCYEALRHCYHILGRERFRAETDYVMKCFDIPKQVEVAKPIVEDLPVENKVIEIKKENAKPILKKVKDAQHDETPKNEVIQVGAPKIEAPKIEAPKTEAPKIEAPKTEAPKIEAPKTEAPKNEVIEVEKTKWKRTQLPNEERCKRILPYNGGQCTFKKVDGYDYCTRHVNK